MKANGFYDGCTRIVRQVSLKGRREGSKRKKAGSKSNCQFLRKPFFLTSVNGKISRILACTSRCLNFERERERINCNCD